MAAQVAVHGAAEVRFEHKTYDAGKGTEFRTLDLSIHGPEGQELLTIKVYNTATFPNREPIVLRPVKDS